MQIAYIGGVVLLRLPHLESATSTKLFIERGATGCSEDISIEPGT